MSDDEEIAALVIDNGSGLCKGMYGIHRKQRAAAVDFISLRSAVQGRISLADCLFSLLTDSFSLLIIHYHSRFRRR